MKKGNNKEVDVHGLTSNKREDVEKCCFCGEELDQYGGNNPWPFKTNGRCCKFCNDHFVIPLRIRIMRLEHERHLAEQQSVNSQS
jgi:hypothetical protein